MAVNRNTLLIMNIYFSKKQKHLTNTDITQHLTLLKRKGGCVKKVHTVSKLSDENTFWFLLLL